MRSDLDKVFHPSSIAVIGASADEKVERDGWVGRLQDFGFEGRIYPVNPRAQQILGLKAYASVKDIPDPVDFAIVTVRASLVPRVLGECVAKGVCAVHIHSGGFADSVREDGLALQKALEDVVRGSRTRVIGPNCLGVYSPAGRISFNVLFPKESGRVAIVAQTASALIGMMPAAEARGLRFSKVLSYGNAIDVDCPELLEYLAGDPGTDIVFAYIEGVKDGRRLLAAATACSRAKPLVILKGGRTRGGERAITSHTASLVGAGHVWQAFFRQTRAVPVASFDEALNQISAFRYLPPPVRLSAGAEAPGRRVGIVGLGGGWSVVATDLCEQEGLEVPGLAEDTIRALERMDGMEVGRMVRNPVELGLGRPGLPKNFGEGVSILAADPAIDVVLVQFYPGGYVHHWEDDHPMDRAMDAVIAAARGIAKPLVVSVGPGHDERSMAVSVNAHKRCYDAGLPVFYTVDAAARAVSKVIGYHEGRAWLSSAA